MHTHDPLQPTERPLEPSAVGHGIGGYRPGIDGLRAVAVSAVVAFHLWPRTIPGGFLGVSLFFTLSGYLITSLLLAEQRRSGRIDLIQFLARRFRRLAPLSLVVIAAVTGWALVTHAPSSTGGEILASLFYVNNWWAIATGEGYGQLFQNPSPLEHFWSLAIEEQFYLLFPLVALFALRRSVPTLQTVVAALFGASFLLAASGVLSHETTYLSTATRGSEILAGALLAILWRPQRAGRPRRPDLPGLAWLGPAAVAVLVLGSLTISFEDAFVSRGGLSLLAVVWCVAVLWAAGAGQRNLLSSTLAVWIGRRSYAIYLIHWPVIVWWRAPALAQVALTVALAALAHRFVEEPVRTRRALPGRVGMAVGLAVMVVLTGAAAVVATRPAPPVETVANRVEAIEPGSVTSSTEPPARDESDEATAPTTTPPTTAPPNTVPPEPVIWWVGDSQADGVLDYLLGRRDPEADPNAPRNAEPTASRVEFMGASYVVVDLSIPGCDGAFGVGQFDTSPNDPSQSVCTDWQWRWQTALDSFGPPHAIVWMSGAATFLRPWVMEDGNGYYPVDAEWMRRWRASIEQRLDWLEDEVPEAPVLWTELMTPVRERFAAMVAPSDEEWARTMFSADAVTEAQRSIAAGRSGVTLRSPSAPVEMGGAGVDLSEGTYDGIHLDREASATFVLPWLFTQVDELLRAGTVPGS